MKPIIKSQYRSTYEAEYAQRLELLKCAGEIMDYLYEPLTVNIGVGAKYKPDFLVVFAGHFEFHEVKGYRRTAGIVRLRCAAKLLPYFKFVLVEKDKGSWKITKI